MDRKKLMMQTGGYAPFSPTNISGLIAWYDGSDASTITIGTGISQWNDKSGAGHHLTQAVGAQQPTVSVAAQNGLNGVLFTAASSQYFSVTNPPGLASAGQTTFMVGKKTAAASNMVGLNAVDGTNAYLFLLNNADAIYTACKGTRWNQAAVSGTTAFHQYTLDQATGPASSNFYVDGVPPGVMVNIGGAGTGNSFTRFGALAATYSNCTMLEYLTYDAVLSRAQEQQVEAYLKAKWATP